MSQLCSVESCKNLVTHIFPKDPELRRKWLVAIRRPDYIPNKKSSGLCHSHFKQSDYIVESSLGGFPLTRRKLITGAVPSLFDWSEDDREPAQDPCLLQNIKEVEDLGVEALSDSDSDQRPKKKRRLVESEDSDESQTKEESASATLNILDVQCEVEVHESNVEPKFVSRETQTIDVCPAKVSVGTETGTRLSAYSIDTLRDKPEWIAYCTGLSDYATFRTVLFSLGHTIKPVIPYSSILNVSLEDQFLIVLWKLRRNTPNFELGMHFGISPRTVSNLFVGWIRFMARQWEKIDLWPSRSLVDFYMPENFRQNFPKTRVIIDGTEVPIPKSEDPLIQQSTFSTYKNTNTLKVVVGATPGGLISYCSPAYGGSTSDRQIVERSELLSKCDSGDSIMADRGFNIQDLFASKDVTVNIPTFLRGKGYLKVKALKKDRKIAQLRVHIERIIGLTKTYKIVQSRLNQYFVPICSEIFYCVVMLCNFREGLINIFGDNKFAQSTKL